MRSLPIRLRSPSTRRPWLAGCLALLVLAGGVVLGGCGGGSGNGGAGAPGTVALRNETDQGMAPLTIEQFFLEPVGSGISSNRLPTTLPPGGVVIIGLFPPGLYNASAIIEGGGAITWMDEEIVAGQPKNFVIPGQ